VAKLERRVEVVEGKQLDRLADRMLAVASDQELAAFVRALEADLAGVEVDPETAQLADQVWAKVWDGGDG